MQGRRRDLASHALGEDMRSLTATAVAIVVLFAVIVTANREAGELAEVDAKERELILRHRSNDPAVGYNRWPTFRPT